MAREQLHSALGVREGAAAGKAHHHEEEFRAAYYTACPFVKYLKNILFYYIFFYICSEL